MASQPPSRHASGTAFKHALNEPSFPHQKMLQDVEDAHTVSVSVAFSFNTVVRGFLHLTAKLGGNVDVVRSQQEQSLLYILV